jgi:hypothetical protein
VNTSKLTRDFDQDRRCFLGAAVVAAGAAGAGRFGMTWWYQYYFTTERGVLGLTEYRAELGEFIWKFNSPTWHYSQQTYDQTAAAFTSRRARVRKHRTETAACSGHRRTHDHR